MVLFIVSSLGNLSVGQEIIPYSDLSEVLNITGQAYYLVDSTADLQFEHFHEIPVANLRHGKGVAHLGFQSDPVWIKFFIHNISGKPLFLVIENRLITRIDGYVIPESGDRLRLEGGMKTNYEKGIREWSAPVFSLGTNPVAVILKISGQESLGSSFYLASAYPLLQHGSRFSFFYGVTIWIPALLGLFALIGFVITSNRLFGLYALLQLGHILIMLYNIAGNSSMFLFNEFIRPNAFTYLVFMTFAFQFLELPKRSPKFYRLLWILVSLALYSEAIYTLTAVMDLFHLGHLWIVGALQKLKLGRDTQYLIWMSAQLLLYFLAWRALFRGFRPARFFVLGFSLLLVSVWLSLLGINGVLPTYPFIYAFGVGILTDSVFFAFALADRINVIRKEREDAQSKLLLQVQENQRQQLQLYRLRDEIARDMHDNIGSSLSTISIITETIKEKIPAEIRERTARIGHLASDITYTLGDLIWSIDPGNDRFQQVLYRIREHALNMLESQDVQVQFDFFEFAEDFVLPMKKRKDFYLIFKEAINNCAKYADAELVTVEVDYQMGYLEMRIRDDGKGFDIDSKEGRRNKYGLRSMRNRAAALGGDLQITSSPGAGTAVFLRFRVT